MADTEGSGKRKVRVGLRFKLDRDQPPDAVPHDHPADAMPQLEVRIPLHTDSIAGLTLTQAPGLPFTLAI